MSRFESAVVPFQSWGNYSVLTDMQLIEMPWLREFIERFPICFERDERYSLFIFWPEGKPNQPES